MRIVYTRRAARDLRYLQDYIAERNPAAAHRMTQMIRERIALLAAQPRLGRPGRVSGTRELVIAGTPYLVPYRIERHVITVVAVVHGRQRWPSGL